MPKLANDLSLTKNTRLNSLGPSKIRAFDDWRTRFKYTRSC